MPFFSIIVPTYNSETHIVACLDSIISQTFSDFELIIQDGLSTDKTLGLITDRLSKVKELNVVIQSEEDRGVYDAMNKGIQRATGDWLYFLGSDDRFYNEHVLQDMHTECSSGPVEIIYGKIYNQRSAEIHGEEFTPEKLYEQNICHQAIFFKRRVFEKIGPYNADYKILADWDHNFKWFFDPSVHKRFTNKIIAFYGDNGLSWNNPDVLFQARKPDLYYSKAKGSINLRFKKGMLKVLTVTSYRQKRYLKAARHLLNYFFLRLTHPAD